MMTTQEIAERLVELCRAGQNDQAVNELYSPKIISIEPESADNRVSNGLEELAIKAEEFRSKIERVNANFVSDPIVAGNIFSCSMKMNVMMKNVPEPVDMDEICVYTVKHGKVIKEEFFF